MTPIGFIIGLVVLIVIGATALVFIGLRNPQTSDDRVLQSRLEEFNQRGEKVDLEKIELSLPFQERIIFPMARKLGELAIKFTPQNAMQNIARKLELAGSPGRLDPTVFLALQFIAAAVFGEHPFLGHHLGANRLAFRPENAPHRRRHAPWVSSSPSSG